MQFTLAAVALFFSAALAKTASTEEYQSDLSTLEDSGCDTVSKCFSNSHINTIFLQIPDERFTDLVNYRVCCFSCR